MHFLVEEIAVNGQHKLISTEAELEATRRLREEDKERYNRIQSEASEKIAQAMENARRATEGNVSCPENNDARTGR